MWSFISNASAVITCFLFILYIIGHIWKVIITRQTRFEKFQIQRFEEDENMDMYDNTLILDDVGEIFVLSSSYGIRNINIYDVVYELDGNGNPVVKSWKLKKTHKHLDSNEPLCIQCDLGEVLPKVQFEIERSDYTVVIFTLMVSGKNGNVLAAQNYGFKMTFKSFLYYLCI